LLGRRVESVPLLLVLTYRDDELARHHPLRTVLGGLRPTLRLRTEPLSPAAVGTLAAGLDAAELHRITGGNPFFVSEVVAAGNAHIPATVREAVLARVARLGDAAADVLDAVSVAVPYAELELLDALAQSDGLDDGLAAGILQAVPGGVAFRHELARRAVEESLGPHRRRDLHRRALAAPSGGTDPARLAHHAEAAGDPAAVLRYAPAAAVRAASTGAHREAAEQTRVPCGTPRICPPTSARRCSRPARTSAISPTRWTRRSSCWSRRSSCAGGPATRAAPR
jgi:hypothetical protein